MAFFNLQPEAFHIVLHQLSSFTSSRYMVNISKGIITLKISCRCSWISFQCALVTWGSQKMCVWFAPSVPQRLQQLSPPTWCRFWGDDEEFLLNSVHVFDLFVIHCNLKFSLPALHRDLCVHFFTLPSDTVCPIIFRHFNTNTIMMSDDFVAVLDKKKPKKNLYEPWSFCQVLIKNNVWFAHIYKSPLLRHSFKS